MGVSGAAARVTACTKRVSRGSPTSVNKIEESKRAPVAAALTSVCQRVSEKMEAQARVSLSTPVEGYSFFFFFSLSRSRALFLERLKAASTVHQEQSAQPSDRLALICIVRI